MKRIEIQQLVDMQRDIEWRQNLMESAERSLGRFYERLSQDPPADKSYRAPEYLHELQARRELLAGVKDELKNCEAYASVTQAINEAQKLAKARLVSAEDIAEYAYKFYERITKYATKTSSNGSYAFCDPNAQRFPGAYHGVPESTHFTLFYRNGKVYLEKVYRSRTYSGSRMILQFAEPAKEKIINAVSTKPYL